MDTDILTVKEAAKLANVSPQTIRNAAGKALAMARDTPPVVFTRAAVEAFKSRRVKRFEDLARKAK